MVDLHVFRSERGDFYAVGESADHVVRVSTDGPGWPGGWSQLPDGEPLTIDYGPEGCTTPVTKTCGEWALENGTGDLASKEF